MTNFFGDICVYYANGSIEVAFAKMDKAMGMNGCDFDKGDMAMPKKQKEAKDRRITIVATESWYTKLEEDAVKWGMTISQYIRFACDQQRRRDAEGETTKN